jgi:hypothetical protein
MKIELIKIIFSILTICLTCVVNFFLEPKILEIMSFILVMIAFVGLFGAYKLTFITIIENINKIKGRKNV